MFSRRRPCLIRTPALILLLWGLLCTVPVQAQTAPSLTGPQGSDGDWHYRARPDENLADITERLLATAYSTDDLRRHNGLSQIQLSSGDTVRIPMQWLKQKPAPARVTSARGDALVRRHLQATMEPLSGGMLLNVGDSLRTGRHGQVKLTLADGSTLRIDSNSTLTLNRLTQFGRTGMADTRMRLDRGRIKTRIKPVEDSRSRFEVETPSAVATIRGTVFEMQVDESGTRLAVTEGQVLFGEPGREVMIPAGRAARQEPGRPLRSQPLPAAPTIASSDSPGTGLPLTLNWQDSHSGPVRVDLLNEESGQWLISRTINSGKLTVNNLDNGEYRLELAALDSQGLQGMTATHRFQVDQPPPPVVLPGSRVIHVNTLGDRVTLFWQTVNGAEDYQLQLASDPDFRDILQDVRLQGTRTSLELEPGSRYHVRIRPRSDEAAKSHWGPAHSLSLE
ncbi:MAG: FecR family protein [Oleiphilaceae bacterium]|nr:FecR family protein [Oleiphilaceae bacterium]